MNRMLKQNNIVSVLKYNYCQEMTEVPSNNVCEIMLIMNEDEEKRQKKQQSRSSQAPKQNNEPQTTSPDASPEKDKVRLKSTCRKICIGLIISLSAVMFGYSIKEITSVPIDTLVSIYGITIDKFIAQSILIGILPLCSIIGAVICTYLIKRFRRLAGIYVFMFVNVGAIILVNITTFYTLLIGRAIQGVCIGYYSAIAPIYLREIAPKQLRRMMGLFFSFGKMVGVLLAIFIELIVTQALGLSFAFRIILSVTAVLSVLQAVLIFFFGSQTPTELLERGEHEEAKQVIKKFYHEEYVQQVMEEYKSEHEASKIDIDAEIKKDLKNKKDKKKKREKPTQVKDSKADYKLNEGLEMSKMELSKQKERDPFYQSQFDIKPEDQVNESQTSSQNSLASIVTQRPRLTFDQKKAKAYCLGVHLAGVKNFSGANAIITQGGIFIKLFNPGLGNYTSLIVNIIQFFAVVFGMLYVQKIMGKKPLFLISMPTLGLLNLALVIAMIYENVTAMLFLMCLFLTVFGMGFISPIWAYPTEVIPAVEQTPVNILHWVSIAICMLIPPLIASFMPGNNPFPVFIFFGIYCFVGFIHVRTTLRESDGRTYKEIIDDFK